MRANNIKQVRERLGLSQIAFADAVGVSQASISNYERGTQQVSPGVAQRVISVAQERGVMLTFDDVYAPEASVRAEGSGAKKQSNQRGTVVIPVVTPERRAEGRRDHERRDGERRDSERRGEKGAV